MTSLATSTALHASVAIDGLRQRSSSDASSTGDSAASSSSHSSIDAAATSSQQARTTRQNRDWRPTPGAFYNKKVKDMSFAEKICYLAKTPDSMHELKENVDRGPIPTQSMIRENIFILSRATIPLWIQGAAYYAFPQYQWPTAIAYVFYLVSFMGFALTVMSRLNHYCVALGTFDEENIGRDRTPEESVGSLAKGVVLYMLCRTGMTFYLHYDKEVNPLTTFDWTYPLRLAAWQLTLDYFFYVYHRASHEVDALWFIHQQHHSTKHPTAILAILAGDYQECLEIALIPLVATLLVPMSFSELYLTLCYTIYVEMLGHSGIRSYWTHPVLWILKPIGAELSIEDHELHHENGKSGLNYGKQSRFWDLIFGTRGERTLTKGRF